MEIKNLNDCQFLFDNKKLLKYTGTRSNVVIPDDIDTINENSFRNNKYINSLVLPEGIQEIQENAFFGCENLEVIFLPNSLKIIGQCAFSNIHSSPLVYYNGTLNEYNKICKGEPFVKINCLDGIYSQDSLTII